MKGIRKGKGKGKKGKGRGTGKSNNDGVDGYEYENQSGEDAEMEAQSSAGFAEYGMGEGDEDAGGIFLMDQGYNFGVLAVDDLSADDDNDNPATKTTAQYSAFEDLSS